MQAPADPSLRALITGASSGIGEVFARTLAAQGHHLVLVARSRDRLQALADELTKAHGIRADVITADLSRPEGVRVVVAGVTALGCTVDMLVNNAGFGKHGRFESLTSASQHDAVMLNVAALVDLTHAFLPAMIAARRGAIVNVASTAAFQPVPYMAVYAATRAFVLSFSEALWGENRAHGVEVLALCPGATDTAFFDVAGDAAALGDRDSPQRVVDDALNALARGRATVVSGWRNAVLAWSIRWVSREQAVRISGRLMAPKATAPTPSLGHG